LNVKTPTNPVNPHIDEQQNNTLYPLLNSITVVNLNESLLDGKSILILLAFILKNVTKIHRSFSGATKISIKRTPFCFLEQLPRP